MPLSSRKKQKRNVLANSDLSSTSTCQPVTVTLKRRGEDENGEDDDDGYESYSSAVTTFDARIRLGPEEIGKAHLVLVDRSSARGSSFHMMCDEHSGELERVAAFICDRKGKADHRSSIHGLDSPTGGFLYIESFCVEKKYRHSEGGDFTRIGAEALRNILNHHELRGEWSLAVYIPDSAEELAKTEKKATTKSVPPKEKTREAQENDLTMIRRGCKMDARQFFRAGFRQVTPPSLRRNDYYHMFAVPSFVSRGVSMISHDEAISVNIIDAPERPLPPIGKDLEIWQCTQTEMMRGLSCMMIGQAPLPCDLSGFESEIRKLVSKGGAIEGSNAVHECAKHGQVAAMDVLLRIAGGKASEAINAMNADGHTPLMEAATAATMNYLCANPFARKGPSPVGICDKLISRGADTAKTDASGLTALGHMRKQAVSSMRHAGGYKATMEKMEHLTRLLMPVNGPSLADNAMLSISEDCEESDRDGSFDEDYDGDY